MIKNIYKAKNCQQFFKVIVIPRFEVVEGCVVYRGFSSFEQMVQNIQHLVVTRRVFEEKPMLGFKQVMARGLTKMHLRDGLVVQKAITAQETSARSTNYYLGDLGFRSNRGNRWFPTKKKAIAFCRRVSEGSLTKEEMLGVKEYLEMIQFDIDFPTRTSDYEEVVSNYDDDRWPCLLLR